jgi:preprotein translocase subunit SecG
VYVVLVSIYIVICFFLILVVLLQQGKGADIAGAFGGGGSQTAFGARGATTFLHKLTTGAFVGFVLLSVVLSILEARPRSSVIKTLPAKAATEKAPVPAAPAAQPATSTGAQPAAAQPAPAQPAAPSTSSQSPAKP